MKNDALYIKKNERQQLFGMDPTRVYRLSNKHPSSVHIIQHHKGKLHPMRRLNKQAKWLVKTEFMLSAQNITSEFYFSRGFETSPSLYLHDPSLSDEDERKYLG